MCCTGILESIHSRGAFQASTWHLELNPEPRSASAARRFVAGCIGPLDDEATTTLELLTSELVTNAILHARTPLLLGVARSPDQILVCVQDRNLLRPEQQPYSEERIDGRGMVIVQALADRWGIAILEQGKAVWFTMRPTADSDAGATR